MPHFCINDNAQPTGEHEVHNLDAGCSFLPDYRNRRDLGFHANCHSAIAAAKKIYSSVDGCAYCVPECHKK